MILATYHALVTTKHLHNKKVLTYMYLFCRVYTMEMEEKKMSIGKTHDFNYDVDKLKVIKKAHQF